MEQLDIYKDFKEAILGVIPEDVAGDVHKMFSLYESQLEDAEENQHTSAAWDRYNSITQELADLEDADGGVNSLDPEKKRQYRVLSEEAENMRRSLGIMEDMMPEEELAVELTQ